MPSLPPLAPDQSELTVGELARRSGVSVSALHFYERKGLIASTRSPGNQRRYPRAVLRRVAVVRVAARLGIPLAVVARALGELPSDGMPGREDWERLSATWRDDLDARIEQLQRLRDDLGDCIGCGCLSTTRCALVNPGDRLGADGAGARTLEVPLAPEPGGQPA